MTAIAWELATERVYVDEESPSAESKWAVTGATSYPEAYATLGAVLPTTFTFPSSRIAYLDGVTAEEQRDDEFFIFRVRYSAQPRPTFEETEYEFEISVQTERIFQSLATVAFAPAGKVAPNFGGAIGLRGGVVEGAEPLTAFSTFSITKYWPIAFVNQAYQITVEALAGSVCADPSFNGRPPGTIRFLGARGRRSGDKFPISYQFGFRPNVAGFAVDAITVTDANGWDIVDPYYEFQPDLDAKKIVQRARAVYVHRIHPLVSFSALGL